MVEDDACGARTESRTNLFVMATISGCTAAGPVKVRNLSRSGALIEAKALPATNEKVRLLRGALSVTGEVVWRLPRQAGLRFLKPVDVKEWLPTSDNRAAQQRLDELFQQLRANGPVSPWLIRDAADADPACPAELDRLAAALEALANDLADDPEVVARHAPRLQVLDIAVQTLRRLAVREQ